MWTSLPNFPITTLVKLLSYFIKSTAKTSACISSLWQRHLTDNKCRFYKRIAGVFLYKCLYRPWQQITANRHHQQQDNNSVVFIVVFICLGWDVVDRFVIIGQILDQHCLNCSVKEKKRTRQSEHIYCHLSTKQNHRKYSNFLQKDRNRIYVHVLQNIQWMEQTINRHRVNIHSRHFQELLRSRFC